MARQSVSWFRHGALHVEAGPAIACASVLKPLYAWVAGSDHSEAARAAVACSDNEAAEYVVERCGGLDAVLAAICERAGVRWASARTWGQVAVRADELVTAYAALRSSTDPWAERVVAMMCDVVPAQRLGVDALWPTSGPLAVKAGWDLDPGSAPVLRTLAVAFDAMSMLAVCSAAPVSDVEAVRWQALLETQGAEAVLSRHVVGVEDVRQVVRTVFSA
jgi:hypothetical protein